MPSGVYERKSWKSGIKEMSLKKLKTIKKEFTELYGISPDSNAKQFEEYVNWKKDRSFWGKL